MQPVDSIMRDILSCLDSARSKGRQNINTSEIAARINQKKEDVNTLCDILEDKGWIEVINRDEVEGRLEDLTVAITDRGREEISKEKAMPV